MAHHAIKYKRFLDIISDLKEKFGADIFQNSTFWALLIDHYNFQNESDLKNIVSECIKKGYVKDVATASKSRVRNVINNILSNHVNDKEEVAALIFGVAIALEKLTISDYLKTVYGNVKRENTFSITLYLILGLLILVGSVYFYAAYLYHDFPIGLLIFSEAVAQLWYTVSCSKMLSKTNRFGPDDIEKTTSILLPVLWSFFIVDITPLLLIINELNEGFYITFSKTVGMYNIATSNNPTGIEPSIPESPGIFTFLGTLLFLFCLFSLIWNIINIRKNNKIATSTSYSNLSFISIGIIALIFGTWISIHAFQCINHRKDYYKENEAKALEIDHRAQINKTLSFQGIELGSRIDTVSHLPINNATSYSDSLKIYSDEPSVIVIKSSQDIVNHILSLKTIAVQEEIDKYPKTNNSDSEFNDYPRCIVNCYSGKSVFYDNEISINIIEEQDKIICIIIKPLYSALQHTFQNFDEIYDLYVAKYGTPTVGQRSADYFRVDPTDTDGGKYFSWKFKNAEIQLSKYEIVYVDQSFVNQLRLSYLNYQRSIDEKLKERDDSINLAIQIEDSIKRVTIIQDSLRRIKNRRNAINEI
ncbi:hypothetical protein HDR70_03325 [bacterium]|nr:hypothetical protein [bacterium]